MKNFKGYLAKIQIISNSNSFGQRFAGGTFWLFFGNVMAQMLSLSASIIVARLLGKVGFGEFGMINSTVGTFGIFAGLGLGLTSTKYIAEWKVKEPERAGRILGFSTLLALLSGGFISMLVFLLAPILAKDVINAPHLFSGLRISSLLLFVSAVNGMQMGALSGFEAFKRSSQINIVRGVTNIIFTGIGTWFLGLQGALWATVIAGTVVCFLSYRAIQQECKANNILISYSFTKDEVGILWKFTLPALISNILVSPALWIGNTLLVNQPNGYAEMGLLNAANQWRIALMFLPTIFNTVALPILSLENSASNNRTGFDNMIDVVQSVSIIAVVPATVFIILLGDLIMKLYGNEFSNGTSVLAFTIVGIAISAIGSVAGVAIQSKGKMWLGAMMNLTWALIYIVFAGIFVKYWNAIALAVGFTIAHVVLLAWGYIYLGKELPKGILKRTFSAVFFILLFATMSILITPKIKIWLLIPFLGISLLLSITKWSSPVIWQRTRVFVKDVFT